MNTEGNIIVLLAVIGLLSALTSDGLGRVLIVITTIGFLTILSVLLTGN